MYRKIILVFLIFIGVIYGKDLDIFFIDVGEGEATLIVTPDNRNILIDTGNLITGHTVAKFLRSKNINTLDRLIITHPHPDHSGGVFAVLQGVNVIQKHDNGQPVSKTTCKDLYRWYTEIFRTGNYSVLKKGDKIIYGEVALHILSPDKLTRDWNENSLVILVKYKKTRVLLMADANKKTEKFLLKTYKDLKADLLKVGHHGADDVLLEEFLNRVNPEYAVISINQNNIRGYPSERVINMLVNKGVKLYITFRDGTVHFRSDGEKIWLAK
ncbi:ComEC/Rec2 family competence protein [Persephonella sp.]